MFIGSFHLLEMLFDDYIFYLIESHAIVSEDTEDSGVERNGTRNKNSGEILFGFGVSVCTYRVHTLSSGSPLTQPRRTDQSNNNNGNKKRKIRALYCASFSVNSKPLLKRV